MAADPAAKASSLLPTAQSFAVSQRIRGDTQEFRLGYRRSLDGVRGVSIVFVVAVHCNLLKETFGFIGVDIFFVLSGFLITCLLLQEWKQSHDISLRAFYARRALRLLPALFAVLLACLVYTVLIDPPEVFRRHVKEILAALFYFMNWKILFGADNVMLLRHTWSLSIEEQFYVIWPLMLLFGLRRGGTESILNLVFLAAFLSWATRVWLHIGTTVDAHRLYFGLDTRADSLLLGCTVAAFLMVKPLTWTRGPARLLPHLAAWLSIGGIVFIGVSSEIHTHRMQVFGWLLISIFTAILILHLVTASGTFIHRILENPVLVYLGRISYGLYLWHWPLLSMVESAQLPRWQHVCLCAFLIPAVTVASFHFLEQPCLRLKRRYQKA